VSEVPRFAVVGRVNKGKSSIVATLAEDDSVRIEPTPGTTTEVHEYPVTLDGRVLFALLDTPGFEDAPRALAWLRGREVPASERPARVREFVAAHARSGEFAEERKLLAPILDGASILYVVDGTRPFRPNYEAEMEILRWTGRPGMALVNRIGDGDHGAEWHRALDQYFRIVRDFDAFSVTFEERLRLLRAFRELRSDWRTPVDEAIRALAAERRRRREAAGGEIAAWLADAVSYAQEVTVDDPAELAGRRERLEASFHDALRAREREVRRRVERIYRHRAARFEEAEVERPVLERDLFAEETWRFLGLSTREMVAASAVAGASAGGAIDAAVGGASLLAGTLLGGALGAGAALYGVGRRLARAHALSGGGLPALLEDARRQWSGARRFRIGPHAGPNFPWVLLDRALLHYRSVATRTHARRGTIPVPPPGGRPGVVAEVDEETRRALARIFQRLRRHPNDPPAELREALAGRLGPALERLDPAGDEAP
jgi:hypothetical protein